MRATLIIGVVLVAAGAGLGAQDPLSAAKDLYASAAYEDALSTLSGMDADAIAPDIARQANQYRAFCLYALGRTREAESIAEAMIRKEPLALLNAADASPRLEMMFSDVRKRLLPSLIRERFRTARSAVDQKSFSDAEPPLMEARLMIADAEKLGVKDDGLGDLSVLVDGFLQLIRSAAEQQVSPRPVAAAALVAAADSTASPQAMAPALAPGAASRPASTSPAPAAVSSARVYSVDDEGVSPPVALEQRMPPMPDDLRLITRALHSSGVLAVVIDEAGRVANATIRKSFNADYDAVIVRSAQRWKYRPAMKDGVPVRYVKTIVLLP